MPTLSWNEIKDRAVKFSKEWENDFNEDAEAKSFMDEFFAVFGTPRRRLGTFEKNIKKENGKQGFIDFLWKGVILIEFKSKGKDLDKAHKQAKDYFPGLKDSELPKYILVSDFAQFRLYDIEEDKTIEFKLKDLVNNVDTENKKRIIGSIFPERLIFENNKYRTPKINRIVSLICSNNGHFKGDKKEKHTFLDMLSCQVVPLGRAFKS